MEPNYKKMYLRLLGQYLESSRQGKEVYRKLNQVTKALCEMHRCYPHVVKECVDMKEILKKF